MKFGIDIGHNCPPDTGASGVDQEDKLTLAVGEALIANLKKAGHTIVNCTPQKATSVNDSLRKRYSKANSEDVDIFISIHFNAANAKAHGSEIYAISKKGSEIANKVLAEIVKLGFKNRGVKAANFTVLKETDMPAILIECCFCDSPIDMKIFNAKEMADAITKGLLDESDEEKNQYTLVIKVPTFLKPSTEQAQDLPPGSCVNLAPGKYQIANFTLEEGHYLVEWLDSSKGKRREHFIFAGHCEIK
jgi:N-acetylmuramoyl-L-alanine amidase